MTTFRSRNQSQAVVPARRGALWAILSDPAALAELTPLVQEIRAEGDLWCWQLSGISALGVSVAPAFTERMTFIEPERIEFHAEAPPGADQRAGARGTYVLSDAVDGATHLAIDITIEVDLPLPRLARLAVERVMAATMVRTGDRFARNLYQRLGLDPRFVTVDG